MDWKDIFKQYKRLSALTYLSNHFSYLALWTAINEVEKNLINIGIKSGDCVGLFLRNPLIFIVLYIALWEMSVVIVPLDVQHDFKINSEIIKMSKMNYLFINLTTADAKLKNEIEFHNTVSLYDCFVKNKSIQIHEIFKAKNHSSTNCKLNGSEIIMFTSGTTGVPKGVVIKKDSLIQNTKKVIRYTEITKSDTTLMTLPLNYSYGISHTLAHLISGGHVIFSKGVLTPSVVLSEIHENSITNYASTSYFYESLQDLILSDRLHPEPNKIRFMMNAGSNLTFSVIKKIIEMLPNILFFNNYGQTEAGPRISYSKYSKSNCNIDLGVGKTISGVKVKVLDPNREVCHANQIGEIWYQSEDMMCGYLNELNDNAENKLIPTGDLGLLDEFKNLHIIGRIDSMIKINGRKLYLQNIENKLQTLDEIKHVKILKNKCKYFGEYLSAYITTNVDYNKKDNQNEIIYKIKQILQSHEFPKKIIFCPESECESTSKKWYQKYITE